jgi:hypothetical protein
MTIAGWRLVAVSGITALDRAIIIRWTLLVVGICRCSIGVVAVTFLISIGLFGGIGIVGWLLIR